MANDDVEKIKEKLSIVDVVSGYVKLQKAGRNFKGKSPFTNERTPSFFVSPDKNLFHCFSSQKGGDIFTFIQEVEGVDFPTALKMLADRAGVTLSKTDPKQRGERAKLYDVMEYATKVYEVAFRKDPEAVQYLLDRGVTKDTMKEFRIGYAPEGWSHLYDQLKTKFPDDIIEKAGLGVKGKQGLYDRFRERIMFPIADSQGRIIAFSGRIFVKPGSDTDPKGTGKYVNSPETPIYHKSSALYGFDKAKRAMMTKDQVVLVEGQMDLIMSHQAGVDQAVALSGTALTEEQINMMQRFTNDLIIALDADEAGIRAAGRSVQMAYAYDMNVRVVPMGDEKDPADLVKEDPDSWPKLIETATDYVSFYIDILKKRGLDSIKSRKALHDGLYPLVGQMKSLPQEEAFKKIAHFLDVSVQATRDDFSDWQQKNPTTIEAPAPSSESVPEQPQKSMPPFQDALFGILLWQEAGNGEIDTELYKGRYKEIVGESWFDRVWGEAIENKNSLIFQAELRYDGQTREQVMREIEQLLTTALVRSLEKQQRDLMAQLRKAEQARDEEASTNYLKEYQTITQKIEDITRQANA